MLLVPPQSDCVEISSDISLKEAAAVGLTNLLWLCQETVGPDVIHVAYSGHPEGGFDGVVLIGKGRNQCLSLKSTLSLAWGDPFKNPHDITDSDFSSVLWKEKNTFAAFNFLALEDGCTVIVIYDWEKEREARKR